MPEPKITPQDKVNALIEDLFPTTPTQPTQLHTVNSLTEATPARQEMFLDALAAGWSETKARGIAQVSKSVLDMWKQDNAFVKRIEDAFGGGTDYLRDLAFIRAHESDPVLLKLLEARDPETYKPRAGGGKGHVNVIINNLYPGDGELDNPQIIIEHKDDDNERRDAG